MHAALAYLEHLLFTALAAAAVIVTVFVLAVRGLARLLCQPRFYDLSSAENDPSPQPQPEPAAPRVEAAARPPSQPWDGGNG